MLVSHIYRGSGLALRRLYSSLVIGQIPSLSIMLGLLNLGTYRNRSKLCNNIAGVSGRPDSVSLMTSASIGGAVDFRSKDAMPVATQQPQTSGIICGFEIVDTIQVEELRLSAVRLRHQRTNAEHIHIKNNDSNNVFLIGVTTPPEDDSGAAHMLEHMVLCASKEFDVKDPFFLMRVRTLSNFMNAYTAYGHTGYVYATHNPRDYVNLQSMYLDAVLHPLLRVLDFHQEAWRYDKSDPDESVPVEFRGVVYSEMMGVYSDPASYYSRLLMTNAYSATPYRYDPGGFPASIPDVDLKGLREYYHKNYHPSKFKTISYGNFNLEEVLSLVDKKYNDFSPVVLTQPASELSSGMSENLRGRIDVKAPLDVSLGSEEHNRSVLISYMLGNIEDLYKDRELYSILEFYLFGGAHSPIYQKIIETGLAKGFAPISGVCDQVSLVSFVIGLRAIKETDVQSVIDLLNEIFKNIAHDGINEMYIKSFYHRALVESKTITGKFGLNLAMNVLSDWANGVDVDRVLDYKSKFNTIDSALKNKDILRNLVKKTLIENPHCLTQVVTHTADFDNPISKEKMALMAYERYQSRLTDSERETYDKEVSVDLPEYQSRETYRRGDLPIVSKGDLPDHLEKFAVDKEKFSFNPADTAESQEGIDLYNRFVTTNGLTYFYFRFDLSDIIPYDLLNYLKIYTSALGVIALKGVSAALLSAKANLLFSKFSLSPVCVAPHANREERNIYITFQVGSLRENVPEAINLVMDILYETDWSDRVTLEQVLREIHDDTSSHLLSDGSEFAVSASGSATNLASLKCADSINGILYAQNISAMFDEKGGITSLDNVISKLEQIHRIITKAAGVRLYIISETQSDLDSSKDAIREAYKKHGVTKINSTPVSLEPVDNSPTSVVVSGDPPNSLKGNTYYIVDSSVAFTSITLVLQDFDHEDDAALDLICSLIDSLYVHKNIRERLSSYGSGCLFSSRSGTINLYSYRTPSNVIGDVLDALLKAFEWVKDLSKIVNDVFMHEAILSVIKRVDAPVAPKDQGISYFYYDTQYDIADKRRAKLLTLSIDDLQAVVNKYFTILPKHIKAVVGPSRSLKALTESSSQHVFEDVRHHFTESPSKLKSDKSASGEENEPVLSTPLTSVPPNQP